MLNRSLDTFTLLEMCLLLCIISMLLLFVPLLHPSSTTLQFECEKIATLIKRAQAIAIKERRDVQVEIKHDAILIEDKSITFHHNVICDEYLLYFNGKGNINMANSISCTYYDWQIEIVMNLGNGNIYVRK